MMRQRLRPSAIAVIGLACRYPEASTPRQLWENILARRRQFRRFPDCRLPLADYYDPDPTVPDKTYGRRAALIDGFDFDWSGRRIPVSTVRTTDMVHWLALETSLAAVADAGYSPVDLPGERTGVIVGNTLTGEQTRAHTLRLRWPFVRRALHRAARAQGLDESQMDRLTQALKDRYLAVFPPVDEDTLAGGLSNTIAGRICNYLNLMGGGFSVDGACASSLLAVAHAASRLVNQDLDLAIVGGVDISLDPFELVGFAKTGALTDGDMMVYDRGGKGFIPGEGCGFMVLKPLADARRDGNPVYAVIRGWGISSDGAGSGITAPSVSGQALALERAYQLSPFGISDLDFIEGHGTGTTVGDRVELEAIAQVLGKAPLNGGEQRPCGITSLKSILGHTKAASGIGGLIKAVMAVNRRVVPPTAACHEPHPAFDHAARRLYPVRQGRRESATKQLRAGVSSMGFGGINCHVTIDSADPPDDRLKPLLDEVMLLAHPQESEVLLIGGGSQTEMLKKIGELIRMADGISMAELADLSAHLSRQLPPDPLVRAAIVTGHPDDLLARLAQFEKTLRHAWPVESTRPATSMGPDMWLGAGNTTPRIGFLFPGQGSQQINMARNLVQRFPWARSRLKLADRITRKLSGVPLSHRVFRDIDRAASSEEKQRWISVLSRTENAQPAICLASMLWLDYLSRLGVRPEAVGGHSLGELTACHAAGGFGAATLLEFAVRRGNAMADQAGVPGAMVSLQCDESTAIALIPRIDGYLTVANRNSPRQTVLSGESAAVEALVGMARENGISARILAVSGAFHSRLSQDAAERVAAMGLLAKPLSATACRFFSSVDGALLESGQPLSGHFSRQIRSRVDFIRLAEEMAACCDLILEVGPGRVLSGLTADVLGEAGPLCLPVEGSAGNLTDLNRALAAMYALGVAIHWETLFENRLIRPFVPAAEKSFVVNPCETLPGTDSRDPDVVGPPGNENHTLLNEALAGVPQPVAARYLESRGAFLKRVIQADLSFWDPDARPLGDSAEKPIAPQAAELKPAVVQATLFGLVSEVTGFSTATLSRNARLLDDLNLDSIKAGDLIARFAKAYGSTFPDPTLLTNAALGDLIDAVIRLGGDRSQSIDRPGQAQAIAPADTLAELIRQAARITGFSGESLDADLPVERDLKIGPEKLQKLIERTAVALGMQPHLDLGPLRSRSLRQIGVILNRMTRRQHFPADDGVGEVLGSAAIGRATWVRNFHMDLLATPYPPFSETRSMRSENDWQNARVLILHSSDTADVAEALVQQLFRRGAFTLVLAIDAESAAQRARDPEFSHLLAVLPKTGQPETDRSALLQRLIHMRASVVSPPSAARAPRRRTTVVWIQFGGGYFGRDPRFARLDCCGALSLGASLHLERADLRVRVVDFSPALPPEILALETLAEMITEEAFAAVGYDHARTRRTFCARLSQPLAYQRRALVWSEADVILVTGGARGITAECALSVARKTGARMALVGRTPHPDGAAEMPPSVAIRSLMARYTALGLSAVYFSCDMADRDAVDRMVAAVTEDLGPITGVIHGAGLNRPRLTGQVQLHQAFTECAPKVLGLLHLMDALEATPPKLMVALGSIIGITGMPGNGWYGFSNEVMDIALRGFAADHPETGTITVAYSIWRDQGMGARLGSVASLGKQGIDAIPTHEGVERFLKIFTHDPGSRQVVITARMGSLKTWPHAWPETPHGFRFLENRIHMTPGVEVVFSTRLSLETDPYLKDHQFQGSFLFPTVFGLEAMAQAACYLTGKTAVDRVQIRDIHLQRPITVDPRSGAQITIQVIRAEAQAEGETIVHAGIRKEGTGDTRDAFSATVVFNPTESETLGVPARPETPLPLVPQTDLYRPGLLFQGPRFQAIETVWEICASDEKAVQALVTARITPVNQRSAAAFGSGNSSHLCLGDPFFCDTLLQSAALLAPQDTSLPIAIDRMDLLPEFFSASAPATLQVALVERKEPDLIYRVAATSENGTPMALLTGYRLRILKHHDDYPTVADLTLPQERDRCLINQALDEVCPSLSLTPPHLELAVIPGIHDMNQPARRKVTEPILKRSLAAAAQRYRLPLSSGDIRWRKNGKPAVADSGSTALDVSLTHDDRICLCVCGPGPLGCDLATVTARERCDWIGVLGRGRAELLDRLIGQEDPLDVAGTRIWTAMETTIKAGGQPGADLNLIQKSGDAVLFAAAGDGGLPIQILTLVIRLTWGSLRIFAVTAARPALPKFRELLLSADYPGYEPLYQTRPFEMLQGGPQGQLVFVQRLPVTFQPSANLSRTIYFSNYIKWMGNTREASAWPVLAQMANQFASGRWGGVTNYGHLKILGEAGTSDRIEIRMWVSDNGGPEDATMTLSYDFRKILPDGGCQRLAFCRLQTTWVEILGPGLAKVAPYPAYYGQFIADMCPRFDAPDIPEPMPESLGHLFDVDDDPILFAAAAGPAALPVIREQIVDTTLSHANLVGNIYYANYYEWQGEIRDRFFYELIPDYFHGVGEKGELLALESRVDHLREAMPFDRILLTMAVKEVRSCQVTLHVDYFRLEPDGSPVKIAYGMHRAAWVTRDAQRRPTAAPFPGRVRAAFETMVQQTGSALGREKSARQIAGS